MDAVQVVGEGNVSLSLNKLKVLDEGTYICTVSLGHFHAQQVIQLHIIRECHPNRMFQFRKIPSMFSNFSSVFSEPPHISLSEEMLVLKSPQTLICHCSKYYPLDAQVCNSVFKCNC